MPSMRQGNHQWPIGGIITISPSVVQIPEVAEGAAELYGDRSVALFIGVVPRLEKAERLDHTSMNERMQSRQADENWSSYHSQTLFRLPLIV